MTLHREGTIIILSSLVIISALSFIIWYFIPYNWLNVILTLPLITVLGIVIWFFRIPERTINKQANAIIAPADGKVVVIEKVFEPEYFKDERIQVSIFMSPFNVHQNVYPIDGEVTYIKYHPGLYLVAWHPKSSTLNERSTVVVKHKSGTEILFRQIAGALARRICPYSKEGDVAVQGEEFGFIKFGSRVDIFLPLDAKICCEINQITTNKITKIAEIGPQ